MQHRRISQLLSWSAAACLALAMAFSPARANASGGELCNSWLSALTTGGWTSLTIVVYGDITQDDAQGSLTPGLDPFYAYDPSTAGVSVSYNSALNQTTITFTGSPLPANYTNIPGHTPHVGIANVNGGSCSIFSYQWGMSGPPTTQSGPAVGVESNNGYPANPTGYYILYLQYTQGSPSTAGGTWAEIPYIGSLPSVSLITGKASPSNPVNFNNAGYWTSPTEIPLDQLEYGYMNPGSPAYGSPWTQLPNPPPLTTQIP